MTTLKEALELAIIEERDNPVPRLVLADLYEEQGEDDLAKAYRSLADRQPDHALAQVRNSKSWDWWILGGQAFGTYKRYLPSAVFVELPNGSGPETGRFLFVEYDTVEEAMRALFQAIPKAIAKGWKP